MTDDGILYLTLSSEMEPDVREEIKARLSASPVQGMVPFR